jgi:uncharacterized repeat protein (TIGR04138 family)
MARVVLESWGCLRTDDFGNIVYNLIEASILTKTDQDRLEDFHDVYDFEQAFVQGYELMADGHSLRRTPTDETTDEHR